MDIQRKKPRQLKPHAGPFAKWLRSVRTERGWSQADLAGRLHKHDSLISIWERGVTVPGPKQRAQLADLFDVTLQHIEQLTDTTHAGHYHLNVIGAVHPAIVHCGPCDQCDHQTQCQIDTEAGLPAHCEKFHDGDVLLAEQQGKKDQLLARYQDHKQNGN